MNEVVRTLTLFALAGLFEIGGGWLMWQWLREDRVLPVGLLGAAVLIAYGVIHTWQSEAEFGRIYAAYSGMFIVLAMGWGMVLDGWHPDRWDIAGSLIALGGVCLMMFAPRNG